MIDGRTQTTLPVRSLLAEYAALVAFELTLTGNEEHATTEFLGLLVAEMGRTRRLLDGLSGFTHTQEVHQ